MLRRSGISHRPCCRICSFRDPEQSIPVYHRHFSSLQRRILSGVEESGRPYLCPSCICYHSPYPTDRIKVVACASTMHKFFSPPGNIGHNLYSGDIIHQEYVTVPGATIDIITNAVKYDFVDTVKKPMDAILISGYNDIIKGHSKERIIRSMDNFAKMIYNQSIRGVRPNTCAIATMMYPPKLTWFDDNNVPQPQGHRNQTGKIDWINNEIHYINMANGVPEYPRIHTYGVIQDTTDWVDPYGEVRTRVFRAHRWNWWRETEYRSMLHLSNYRRFQLGREINTYFLNNTY